jgi:hypothetical protein
MTDRREVLPKPAAAALVKMGAHTDWIKGVLFIKMKKGLQKADVLTG